MGSEFQFHASMFLFSLPVERKKNSLKQILKRISTIQRVLEFRNFYFFSFTELKKKKGGSCWVGGDSPRLSLISSNQKWVMWWRWSWWEDTTTQTIYVLQITFWWNSMSYDVALR